MELSLENILNEVDKIPGGLAKGKTLDDIAKKHNVDKDELKKQLDKGIKVEAEHTTDKAAAKEIAMDHLFEDPKYYDKLSKIDEGTCGYNADVKTGKEFKTPGGIKMRKDPYGLSAFAIELVKEFNNELTEVGELTSTPYNYSKRTDDLELDGDELFGTVVYDFSADDIFYDVVFEYDYDSELNKNYVKVDFTANESYEMTNTNEPYKIMATVFSIIKKELDRDIVKNNLDILLYTPAETKTKGGEAVRLRGINQRNELYKAFFKKNIPYVKMEETPNETRFYLKENQLNEAVRCKALHNTPQNELVPYIKSLTQFMDENLELRPLPKVKFVDDEANASKVLGKTAYYDPQNCAITLYITDRHPKDILRSFAHEMIHHMQNMQGRLGNIGTQNVNQDDNLKELEEEAYQLGNISLRSWENSQDQLDEIKLQPKSTGVGSKLKVNFKLDPSYFKYSKDINSLDDVDKTMFGGWVTSKDLPEIQGMLHRDKSSNIILNIVTDLDDNRNIKVWKDKLTKLDIPHTDRHFNSKNHGLTIYGISDINVNKYIDLKFEQPTNEITVRPGNTGTSATPLTSEEKEWIKKQVADFDPGDTPEGDPDKPLTYTFIDRSDIEYDIEDEGYLHMTPKDLEIFDSIHKKLGKDRIYTFNSGHDNQVDNYPQLRDTVIKADTEWYGLKVIWSDWSNNGGLFGAFDKNTGEYIKYSNLNEIKLQPKNTGVTSALTPKEKEWIDDEFWNRDREYYSHPSIGDPDVPLDFILADERSIKEDIDEDYRSFKDLEIFNSIHRKLGKNKVYTFSGGRDPKIKKYPEDYDLRETVVGADYDDGIPVLYVLDSNFPPGNPEDTYGAFDKDTGEYIKYSDLDKIGKVDEIKIQPGSTGTSATPLTPEEKEWIKKQVADFEVSDTPQNPDEPLIYPLINKNWIIYKFMTPKDLELHDSIHDSIYRKLKNKVYTLNSGYDDQVNNYPQLRDTVIKANTERGDLDIILSDADDNEKYFGAFDKNTGEYIKYSGLNEIKVQPKKTGIKGKINLEFFPNDRKIKSYSDIVNFLLLSPKNYLTGIIKSKDFPVMFVEIFTNEEDEILMDLEANSNHPERYDIWTQRLQDLGIPFKINPPYIDNINVEKNFNIEVNPIS